MRVTSWNLLHGMAIPPSNDPAADQIKLGEAIGAIGADVIGIQEVDEQLARSGKASQTAVVAEAMSTHHWGFAPVMVGAPGEKWRKLNSHDTKIITADNVESNRQSNVDGNYGLGIVSKIPVKHWNRLELGNSPFGMPLVIPAENKKGNQSVKIAAGCMFYDAWDVLPTTISSLILGGVKDFYLVNHASALDLGSELKNSFKNHARVNVFKKKSIEFNQARIMNLLAKMAQAEGFDVFIPFDSDEFWGTDDLDKALSAEIEMWWNRSSSTTLKVIEVDYVMDTTVESFSATDLAKVKFRALSHQVDPEKAKVSIKGGDTYFSRSPSHKSIIRLRDTQGNPTNLNLNEGNHDAVGENAIADFSHSLVIRHLPFRSREATLRRAEQGRRRIAAGFPESIGWQNQMISQMDHDEKNDFWLNNSISEDDFNFQAMKLLSSKLRLIPDDSLGKILKKCNEIGIPIEIARISKSGDKSIDTFENSNWSEIFSTLLDIDFGHNQAKFDQALMERDQALMERDQALMERDQILQSRIWKSTSIYRRLKDSIFMPNSAPDNKSL